MLFNRDEYRKKVLGCWLGKNIGGTLGAPFEWKRQINNVSFYTQDHKGEPLPNDDLDLQLIWLIALEERGISLDAKTLAEYWLQYITPHWVEYGNAKINMRSGLLPPISGTHNNWHRDSCGAFIRSEIWACITPGLPQRAARYAFEDASVDHGNGEGTLAAIFCAALESAAFVEQDFHKLIEIGLSYIPADCGTAGAVRKAVECHKSGIGWREARDEILRHYRGAYGNVSAEDREKGFHTGLIGWDAPSNIGIIVLGLLYGGGDFDKAMCITVNCGEDTDCTAATVGSIFGILHGADAIPKRWIEPIGRNIKTCCLNLGELYLGALLPPTVDALTDRTESIARQIVEIADKPTDTSDFRPQPTDANKLIYEDMVGPTFRFDHFQVVVNYGDEPTVRDGTPKEIRLRIRNTYRLQANLSIRWLAPDNWTILPSRQAHLFTFAMGDWGSRELVFTVQTDRLENNVTRLAVEIAIDGRPTVMFIPITLLNGNVKAPIPDRQAR